MELEEKSIVMNGRLGEYFKLYLRTKVSKDDLYNHLSIRARIVKDKDNIPYKLIDETKFLIENATIYIKIKGDVVLKKSIDLDFINLDNIVLGIYNTNILNRELLNLDISAELVINDKSNYLTSTEMKSIAILTPIVEERLFIDLDMTEKPSTLYFTVKTTITPDFIEYKVNDLYWKPLTADYFEIGKIGKNQYIQVRGKKNNYYSYSNVIKFIEETRD